MTKPNFDNMTIGEIYEWGNELAWRGSQFGEIRATLIVNCKPNQPLYDLGLKYDKSVSVLSNLVHILGTLVSKAKK